MLIILPPSESKAPGGTGPALDFSALSFPQLTDIRTDIAADLAALPADDALSVLKISQRLRAEALANEELLSSPTMPAISRYTGVLYDALDASSLDPQLYRHLAIGSALFGLVRATDPIPHYRLSGGTTLPRRSGGSATMKSRWGTAISAVLSELAAAGELIIDLRSGAYYSLGSLPAAGLAPDHPGALTVRVDTVAADGTRKVVSHFNKFYKGVLSRALLTAIAAGRPEPTTVNEVVDLAQEAGLDLSAPTPRRGGATTLVLSVAAGDS